MVRLSSTINNAIASTIVAVLIGHIGCKTKTNESDLPHLDTTNVVTLEHNDILRTTRNVVSCRADVAASKHTRTNLAAAAELCGHAVLRSQ